MEVGSSNASLLSQITTQLLSSSRNTPSSAAQSGNADRPFDRQLSLFEENTRTASQADGQSASDGGRQIDQNTNSSSSSLRDQDRPADQERAIVRVRGSRSVDDLDISSDDDINRARQRVNRLTNREAPLGRRSTTIENASPPGQVIDIRI